VVLLGKRKGNCHLEEIVVSGMIILNRLFIFEWQEVKSTGLSQGGDNFGAFVVTVLKIWFHKGGGVNFFTFWEGKLSTESALD